MLQVLLKALFDLGACLGIRRTFQNRKIQKSNFSKNQKPYNFFVFLATRTIHTFLKSSDKSVIIRQGQKSDIATGKGSGAKFSLYRGTHCSIRVSQIFRFRCLADRWCISWNVAHMPNFRPFGSSPVQHNGFKVYYINLLHKSDFGDKSANLTPKTCMWKAHNFADFRRIMQLSKDTKNSKIHPVWGAVGVFKMTAFFAKKGLFLDQISRDLPFFLI